MKLTMVPTVPKNSDIWVEAWFSLENGDPHAWFELKTRPENRVLCKSVARVQMDADADGRRQMQAMVQTMKQIADNREHLEKLDSLAELVHRHGPVEHVTQGWDLDQAACWNWHGV